MAEEDDIQSKTEDPTERRLEELARLGQLFVSNEFSAAIAFLIGSIVIYFVVPNLFATITDISRFYFSYSKNLEDLTVSNLEILPVFKVFGVLIVILLTFPLVSVAISLLQTKGNFKENWFNLNFNTLNPLNGLKRIFSLQNFFNFSKSVIKLLILATFFYFAFKDDVKEIIFSKSSNINFLALNLSWLAYKILINGAIILLIFGTIDLSVGYLLWLRQNRMTKQEVKDDRRASEGDEVVKRKIFSKSTARILQQIKKNLATATVVVTNPTHYAVALRYISGKDSAPVVVAKGVDFLALKIRSLAVEYGIPIVERPSLARALYKRLKIGQQIPVEFFKVVAEVIAFVFKTQNKKPKAV